MIHEDFSLDSSSEESNDNKLCPDQSSFDVEEEEVIKDGKRGEKYREGLEEH